jgi:hypothetical protein
VEKLDLAVWRVHPWILDELRSQISIRESKTNTVRPAALIALAFSVPDAAPIKLHADCGREDGRHD